MFLSFVVRFFRTNVRFYCVSHAFSWFFYSVIESISLGFMVRLVLRDHPRVLYGYTSLGLCFNVGSAIKRGSQYNGRRVVATMATLFEVFRVVASYGSHRIVLFKGRIYSRVSVEYGKATSASSYSIVCVTCRILSAKFVSVSFRFFCGTFQDFSSKFCVFSQVMFVSILGFAI